MNTIRQQLDIHREKAMNMGIQAVGILDKGYYDTETGKRVEIREAVNKSVSGTVSYSPDITLPISASGKYTTVIEIHNTTTLAAAMDLISEGYNPVALNMASAISPGGGFLSGARAQEEYLARSTALFACLQNNPMYRR